MIVFQGNGSLGLKIDIPEYDHILRGVTYTPGATSGIVIQVLRNDVGQLGIYQVTQCGLYLEYLLLGGDGESFITKLETINQIRDLLVEGHEFYVEVRSRPEWGYPNIDHAKGWIKKIEYREFHAPGGRGKADALVEFSLATHEEDRREVAIQRWVEIEDLVLITTRTR